MGEELSCEATGLGTFISPLSPWPAPALSCLAPPQAPAPVSEPHKLVSPQVTMETRCRPFAHSSCAGNRSRTLFHLFYLCFFNFRFSLLPPGHGLEVSPPQVLLEAWGSQRDLSTAPGPLLGALPRRVGPCAPPEGSASLSQPHGALSTCPPPTSRPDASVPSFPAAGQPYSRRARAPCVSPHPLLPR